MRLSAAFGMRSMSGMRKLRVLPVPVWAVARTSRPSRAGGMAPAWTGVGVMKFALAICCCRAGERLRSENEFQLILSSGWFGIPSGLVFDQPISSRDPASWPESVPERLGLWAELRQEICFLCRENQGGAYEAPIQDLTHTHCFGWNAPRHEPGGAAAWPGPPGHTGPSR